MSKEEKIQATIKNLHIRIEKESLPVQFLKYVPNIPYSDYETLEKYIDNAIDFDTHADVWGGKADSHALFFMRMAVPQHYVNPKLRIVCPLAGRDGYNPQFTVWIDGILQPGFDMNHTETDLTGKEKQVLIYAYTGMSVQDKLTLSVDLIERDTPTERIYYDLLVPYDVLSYTESYSTEYAYILHALSKAINKIDFRIPYSKQYYYSLQAAGRSLYESLYSQSFYNCGESVVCVGHTHIDIAWLWSYEQTEEKVVRSFTTAIKLLEKYPEYRFMSGQALLYDIVRRKSPILYDKIKEMIKAGRWEAEGAVWVEPDCNLLSGESLIRQILYGKKYFRDEFGVNCKVMWLPDVFGYSAAMPQILKSCGVEYFFTSKISWNDTNCMPVDIFEWKGIDGSEILTYFLTAQKKKKGGPEPYADYVGFADASWVVGTYTRLQQKELSDKALLLCGYGDGGGGTTISQIESLRRLSKGIPGCPPATFGRIGDFFDGLKSKSKKSSIPKWSGELYLEFHRGTYTTQAEIKKLNRKTEYLLQQTELLSVIGKQLASIPIDKEAMEKAWKLLLKNQFHDILPGSSLQEVYKDSKKDFAEIYKICNTLNEKFYSFVLQSERSGWTVFNPHGYDWSGYICIDGRYYYAKDVPAKGYKHFLFNEEFYRKDLNLANNELQNKFFYIKFNDKLQIISLFDKVNCRELISPDQVGNKMVAFEDAPLEYDAWELRDWYKEKGYEIDTVKKIEVIAGGDVMGLKITKTYLNSEIIQIIRIYEKMPRIDFDTEILWSESNTILKVFFPFDVNGDKAVCDIQFGNVERPTHANTSWEKAKFEVPAHKFVDLSEGNYGIAIMTDCKYGYSLEDSTIGISLLRSPTWPDKDADKGLHKFIYSIYPHRGNFYESDVVRMAYDLNMPLIACKGTPQIISTYSFCRCDDINIILETVKLAEQDDGIVLRLYETQNKRTSTILHFSEKLGKVYKINCLEEGETEMPFTDEKDFKLEVRPYEIITLKILTRND